MKTSLSEYFISLVKIDSESRNEKTMALQVAKNLKKLGAKVWFDDADRETGSDSGNLYAYYPGNIKAEPILFCAHLDTVVPGKGIKPVIEGDRIKSDGSTVLGGDDKSGIAEVIWALKKLKDSNLSHGPVEVLFTVCEEIGLLGAKNVDYSRLRSKIGYALDGHRVGELTIGAPYQNTIEYRIYGKEAHAGVEPEKGISAIQIAAHAITQMPLGRIDHETTCNVGLISGGKATNIIPKEVYLKTEVRSHDQKKLENITTRLTETMQKTALQFSRENFHPQIKVKLQQEYTGFRIPPEHLVVQMGLQAASNLNIESGTNIGGGGSDANIFNRNGLEIVIAGTGMDNVHTVNEFILLSELEKGASWVEEVIKIHSTTGK